jgi:hypothetical protein
MFALLISLIVNSLAAEVPRHVRTLSRIHRDLYAVDIDPTVTEAIIVLDPAGGHWVETISTINPTVIGFDHAEYAPILDM